MADPTHVVTCFLRNDAEVLLLRRSESVGSYPGLWGGVTGHAEGNPDGAARREIREETGIDPDDLALVRVGEPFEVYDGSAPVSVRNPTFDVTPADVVTVVTEDGVLDADGIRAIAREHRRRRAWEE